MKRMDVSISESDINALTLEQRFENNSHQDGCNPMSEREQLLTRSTMIDDRDKNLDHALDITNSNDELILSPSDTRLNGHVTADLDIDAIIQSFIREQEIYAPSVYQVAGENTTIYDNTTTSAQTRNDNEWSSAPGTYMSTEIALQPPSVPQLSQQPGDNNYGGIEYVQPTYQNQFSANDMLFGFNSSAMEGIGWELDDSMV
jgi:hypothetical protein